MSTLEREGCSRNSKYKAAFEALGSKPQELKDQLFEDEFQLFDFDGKRMNLLPFQYTVGSSERMAMLVKKAGCDEKLTPVMFNYLLKLKHRMLVPVENFYYRGSNGKGWLVVGLVDGSMKAWLQTTGSSLFEGTGNVRKMSLIFRTMLINIWSLLTEMSSMNIFPQKIRLEDFYVKLMADGVPRIQILITEFREITKCTPLSEEWQRVWLDVDAFVDECCQICGCRLDILSRKFYEHMKCSKDILAVTNYPDIWTLDDKACYLYHIVSGTPAPKYVMKAKVNQDSELQWPKGPPEVIQLILNLDINKTIDVKGHKCSRYDTTKAYDYVMLCRDTHKHFGDLPDHIKEMLGGCHEGLIQSMELWDPEIWTKLYKALGPLGRQFG